MKRLFTLLMPLQAFMLLSVSCVSGEIEPLCAGEKYDNIENGITKSEAFSCASNYVVSIEMATEFAKSIEKERGMLVSIKPYPSKDNVMLYEINYETGWILIPGDARFGLILAEGDNGSLVLSEKSGNPSLDFWIQDVLQTIEAAQNYKFRSEKTDQYVKMWNMFNVTPKEQILRQSNDETLWVKVNFSSSITQNVLANKEHLIQTKWGQDNPWNISLYDPNVGYYKTGCAAVAVSQVLYYLHNRDNSPSGLYHTVAMGNPTYYDSNYDGIADYAMMQNAVRSDYTYGSSHWNNMPLNKNDGTSIQNKYVSDLMLDVGIRLGMHYGTSSSGVLVGPETLFYDVSNCNLNGTVSIYSETIKDSLICSLQNNNSPVLVIASRNNNDGHAWIIDGYEISRYCRTNYFQWYPEYMSPAGAVYEYKTTEQMLQDYSIIYPGMNVEESFTSINELFKMNWGWDGQCDDNQYSMSPSAQWEGFVSNKAVMYNLSAGELLIE
ncbi:MAG: C10 family peptidase [Candidatus Cryptobacteroides sp.]